MPLTSSSWVATVWTSLDAGEARLQRLRLKLNHDAFKWLAVGVLFVIWLVYWVWHSPLRHGFIAWARRRATFWSETLTMMGAAIVITAAAKWWRGHDIWSWSWSSWVFTGLSSVFLYWSAQLQDVPVPVPADTTTIATLPAPAPRDPAEDDATTLRDMCASWTTWVWVLAGVPIVLMLVSWVGTTLHWFDKYSPPQFRWSSPPARWVPWIVEACVVMGLWWYIQYRIKVQVHPETSGQFVTLQHLNSVLRTYLLFVLSVALEDNLHGSSAMAAAPVPSFPDTDDSNSP